MSAEPGVVLLAGLVTSSPALWRLSEGELTFTEAMVRCGLAFAICWVAIAVVSSLAFPDPGSRGERVPERTGETPGAPRDEVAPVE